MIGRTETGAEMLDGSGGDLEARGPHVVPGKEAPALEEAAAADIGRRASSSRRRTAHCHDSCTAIRSRWGLSMRTRRAGRVSLVTTERKARLQIPLQIHAAYRADTQRQDAVPTGARARSEATPRHAPTRANTSGTGPLDQVVKVRILAQQPQEPPQDASFAFAAGS